MFFDPDEFAVTAAPLMSRVALPGLPYSERGIVRDVVFDPDDLPIRCVCFSLRDVNDVLYIGKNFAKHIKDGTLLPPIFPAYGLAAGRYRALRETDCYTYPEAHAIIEAFADALKFGAPLRAARHPRRVAKLHETLRGIRSIALERITT